MSDMPEHLPPFSASPMVGSGVKLVGMVSLALRPVLWPLLYPPQIGLSVDPPAPGQLEHAKSQH